MNIRDQIMMNTRADYLCRKTYFSTNRNYYYYYYYYHHHHHHHHQLLVITFMRGIRSCVPETTRVPRAFNVATTLCFTLCGAGVLCRLWNVLSLYISAFQSMCALPSTVEFCSFLISCFQAQSGHMYQNHVKEPFFNR